MAEITLRPPKAPNLLVAPIVYDQRYIDQLTNALRLYFNQIDNGMGFLLSDSGGSTLSLPHIAASDNADQLATASNTPTEVKWDTLESGLGWTLNAPGTATANVSGVYTIRYSLQFANTDNAQHDAAVWLRINTGSGFVDVPRSTTIFSIPARKSAGVFSYVCAYSEATFQVDAGDTIALYWATGQAYSVSPATAGVYIEHIAAQTSPYARPATPSAIGSITFVSRLP
jgi:plastocyanin